MAHQLFLASTPLHLLNSVAIASRSADINADLWLIDQPVVADNPYHQLLNHWQGSPFNQIHISGGQHGSQRAKLNSRRQTFARLQQWVEQYRPATIFTGNDRRIEFQYAMHCAQQTGRCAKGVYMDEGTFTYVGRKASASFSDRIIDSGLKKLIYGRWWQSPPTIGGSAWIDEIFVAFPQLVHPLLQQKQAVPLQPLFEGNTVVQDFCQQLLNFFAANTADVGELDCILTLPHESIIERLPGYRDAMLRTVQTLQAAGLRTGIKYHPRNSNPDILNAAERDGFVLLPHRVPFEALLPLLPANPLIIGDVSSTLINSRWLRPDARLLSIANPNVDNYEAFCQLFAKLQVQVCSSDELTDNLQALLTCSL
ncbi:hypothetical protein GCM10011297_27220 [Bacterioplanes sanyensis]|uniref:polysialyltransferase family glycosyltransferase n=1 Tax=Bacterioplanes sanyensis TaxID=1249553 RepID=UPI0016783FBB|nr:polysialyltransferase family glycosyltransferase [Bacterioplanes sanyensis]GGY52963.1 hypothetical protein GCM10011297_27220 [Bacterioplanes sanyensis]